MALRGESHPLSKLTTDQILIIRKLWKAGFRNIKLLAHNHNVSPANIKKIVHRETWTHL
jgi:uncharacterized protein YjcR